MWQVTWDVNEFNKIVEQQRDIERRVLELNRAMIAEGMQQDCAFGFEGQDFWVIDPYTSVCGRFEVDPVKEYGLAYLQWFFSLDESMLH